LTDDALLDFLGAYIDHARHLMAFHMTGNWLAMEGNGLFHVGVLFPEFQDAPRWRETSSKWIYAELDNQVYPDGVQIELASGYHHVSLLNFLMVFKIARLNGISLPEDFLKRLEKMYDFDVFGATPSRLLPGVQDGGYYDVRKALGEAAELYPQRKDFLWYATDGRQGRPPAETSHAFPYAGYFVQRSGWDANANWLWFDGGPFGYGHQPEDKLQILVEAYGKSFLVDPGNYTYEKSKWRSYFIDSPSHNVVLVDGQPQRRRGAASRMDYVVKEPLPHVWQTGRDSDYVEATYDEAFGGGVGRSVKHTRAVLFIKPGFWVMLDRLTALDGKEHTYESLLHFDCPVRADGLRVVTTNEGAANLTVLARASADSKLKIVEGQQDPVQGWLTKGISSVRPAPVAIYEARGQTVNLLYVLAPAPAGAPDPVRSLERIGGDDSAARIVLRDGRTYEVRFNPGRPAEWKMTSGR
ncbi:MAG: alginate lyase family protein, partial [Acidobacteria bacterium]|nr:alginate lyase family protein [Acidobacteriota bacterium]